MKRICIKRLFLLALAAVIAAEFLSCSSDSGGSGDGSEQGGSSSATLTVKNASSYTLHNVKWNGKTVSSTAGIAPGYSETESVSEGFSYIYFSFYPKNNNKKMDCYTMSIVNMEIGESRTFIFTNDTIVVQLDDTENKAILGAIAPRTTTLIIKNDSSYDLTDVVWQDNLFSSSPVESVLAKGDEITKNVETGSGYISFKRKDTGVSVRTKYIVSVVIPAGNSETVQYSIITDSTDVIELYNETNEAKLFEIEKKVVFLDNAEGEFSPLYTKKQNVRYSLHSTFGRGFHHIEIGVSYYNDVKYDSSTLEWSLKLDKPAKISFFHYYDANDSDANATFLVNNKIEKTWSSTSKYTKELFDMNLSAGNTIFKFDVPSDSHSGYYPYLYLDDILIVYTD